MLLMLSATLLAAQAIQSTMTALIQAVDLVAPVETTAPKEENNTALKKGTKREIVT